MARRDQDGPPLTLSAMRTAYHEAGHVVVGHSFGFPLEFVHVYDDLTGLVWWHGDAFDRPKLGMSELEYAVAHAISLLAGAVCEDMAMGDSETNGERTLARDLMVSVESEAGDGNRCSLETEARIVELEDQARAILSDNWGLVQEFASELERSRYLSGESLADLLRQIDLGER